MTLLAHSFGPVLAARYAQEHPAQIERLIFLGGIGPRRADASAFGAEMMRRMPPASLERMKVIVPLLQGDQQDVDRVALCREYDALERSSLPAGVASPLSLCDAPAKAVDYALKYTSRITFDSFGDWDFTTALKTINTRLLVIYGDQDPSPLASQEAWANAVQDGRLLIIRGAGHNPHSDRPQLVFDAIDTFLAGGWPADSQTPPVQPSRDRHGRFVRTL